MNASLREIARALGGELVGGQVLAPGPNHDRRDRSLSVRWSASSPDSFIVHSFAGDDFKACRDHVRDRLGMSHFERASSPEPRHTATGDDAKRIERAREIFLEGVDPRETLVERYLRGRALSLPNELAGAVLRFHPRCPWRDKEADQTIFVPAMIAAMRSIASDEITAVHRTRLSPEGEKLGRRMLGVAAGAAVKLDADDTVTGGLHIAEGVETALAARQLGLKPTWALGAASFISAFPVLPGIECLTLLAENDEASAKAVEACARRWHEAKRVVLINRPARGKDLNDAIRGYA
jgi:putative DNA primase/helicase